MTTYNIKDQLRGDTFKGLSFEVLIDEEPKNLTGTEIKIDWRYGDKNGEVSKSISDGSGITKTNAPLGQFTIDPFLVELEPGIHHYDLQFKDGEVIKTYIQGTMKVLQDVTQ